jgi:hypothetical protein
MRIGLIFLAALAITASASAETTKLAGTARFQAAFQGSFYGFDVCGDAANGKLYRKALIDKVQRCPYTEDAKAAFSEWAGAAETEGSAEIKRYIAEHEILPPRMDARKANCIAEKQDVAYRQVLALLAQYAKGTTHADAIVPGACDAGAASQQE